MKAEVRNCIREAKEAFETSFKEKELYDRQTQDQQHLNQILDTIQIQKNEDVLDLGTGSGYLAFAMANEVRESQIVGLDIVEDALEANRRRADFGNVFNVIFRSYEGMDFPFENRSFDCITARYALHHFPRIGHTFAEVSRVLKKGGRFFISDPTPNDNDYERFVDAYMKMKKDGHIKYYTKDEFESYANAAGMTLVKAFQTEIKFPRLRETAYGFDEIMNQYKKEVIDGYQIYEENGYIYTTQKVWNLLFEKI